MCCSVQPDAEGNCPEGAQDSYCYTHHPNTGIYTCADHPTAVRVGVETSGKIELNKYKNDKLYVWNIDADCSSVDVDVPRMDTDYDYDFLSINNNRFSGKKSIQVKFEDSFFLLVF